MRLLRVIIAAALFSASLAYAHAAERRVARLSDTAVPVSYDLDVAPDLKSWTTRGEETIVVDLRADAGQVTLNSRGIEISDAAIDGEKASVEYHPVIEQIDIRPVNRLAVGRHSVHLRFVSPILGFGGSKGVEIEQSGLGNASPDTGHPFLVTFFEESTARQAFPCFDEPAFRAPITLHVTAPPSWTVVSNMPVSSREPEGDTMRWHFAPTPAMPAYLLTIDAGEMSALHGASDGIPISVYARPLTISQSADAVSRVLQNAERLLHFYNAYFGVRYPLPKLDIVIAPNLVRSALEQWGGITVYAEEEVLNTNGIRHEREAFEVIAHEIAHQWFGDLVGMHWWSDSFVSEGLAQWAQQKADGQVAPQEEWWQDDDGGASRVMSAPIGSRTFPVVAPIETDLEKDDDTAFGLAVYHKSAAVLRLWEAYLGEDRFREAIRRYLHDNAGKAVSFDAFWASFGDAQSRAYGDAWLKRPDFPLVTITAACNRGRDTIELRQDPFRSSARVRDGYDKQVWPVPLFIRAGSKRYTLLFATRSQRVVAGACNEPLAFDSGLRPYYRIRYAGTLYRRIVANLPRQQERDRANALRDAVRLFNAHYVPAGYLLAFADNAATHDEVLVNDLGMSLGQMLDELPRGPERDAVANLTRRIAEPLARSAIDGTDHFNSALLQALLSAGDPALGAAAKHYMFAALAQHKEGWSPSYWVLTGLAAAAADDASISEMERRSTYESMPYLTNVTTPRLVRRILNDSAGDPAIVFGLARRNPMLVWAYLQRNASIVRSHVPPSQQGWLLAHGTTQALSTSVPLNEMQAFLESSLGPGYRADISAAMAEAQSDKRAAEALNGEVQAWCCRK